MKAVAQLFPNRLGDHHLILWRNGEFKHQVIVHGVTKIDAEIVWQKS